MSPLTICDVIRNLCTSLCSSYYPDEQVVKTILLLANIDGDVPYDDECGIEVNTLFEFAVRLTRGYVETSRSEGGITVSTDLARLEDSIRFMCKTLGLDYEDYASGDLNIMEGMSAAW